MHINKKENRSDGNGGIGRVLKAPKSSFANGALVFAIMEERSCRQEILMNKQGKSLSNQEEKT